MLRVVTFDFTGTLARIYPRVGVQYNSVLSRSGYSGFTNDQIEKHFVTAFKSVCSRWPNYGALNDISAPNWWRSVVHLTVGECLREDRGKAAMTKADLIVEDCFADIYAQFETDQSYQLFPDVIPTLEQLKEKNIRLGVVSNSDQRTGTIMKNLKILKYFDFVINSAQFGIQKPEPEIFIRAVHDANSTHPSNSSVTEERIKIEECWHVGDSEFNDYYGALGAGFGNAFLLRRKLEGQTEEDYNKTIESLDSDTLPEDIIEELTDILEAPEIHNMKTLQRL